LIGMVLVLRSGAGFLDGGRDGVCRTLVCGADAASAAGRDMLTEDCPGALALFQAAVTRDPASAQRWCDLGDALVMNGDIARGQYCFAHAYELGAGSAAVVARVAQFYFGVGDTRRALDFGSRLLRLTRAYDEAIFQAYDWLPAAEVLERGLPLDKSMGQSWFRRALERGAVDDAGGAWAWLLRNHFTDDRIVSEYLDALVKAGEYGSAAEVWIQYLGNRAGDYPESNALFNGGFEMEPTGAVFDWRIETEPDVKASVDSHEAHSGKSSLKLHFSGSQNLRYHHVTQTAYSKAGRYRFLAFVKTAGITTDEGLRFHIFGEGPGAKLDLTTEQIGGTRPWTRIEKTLSVPEDIKLVKIEITRLPSLKFANKIAGDAWMDDASLSRIK
jgi:tetratricopeptide (TPR) repeat protein